MPALTTIYSCGFTKKQMDRYARPRSLVLMQFTVLRRPTRAFVLGVVVSLSLLVCGNALANSCGVLPFTSGRGVNDGAASNITSLVSSEVDIRGGFGLVLTASEDEVSKDCGKKSSCIKSFGKDNGYNRVVAGNVDKLGKSRYRLTVQFWDIKKGSEVREVKHEIERSPDALLEAIPPLVIELLTGKKPEVEGSDDTASAATFDEDLDFGDDEDLDFDDEEEVESGEDTKWMERDRHGRKIKSKDDSGEDPLGFDDLDDLDDLDLDDMTEDSQRKKSTAREEKREREAKRKEEEERLAELAREEERRRDEERRRAEEDRRRRDQEAEAEREAERRETARAEAERRERREREARRQEARDEARRAEERDRRREEERRDERRRKDQEARDAYADDEDEYEDYELEDDEEVIEIESTISLGGGLVIVEDEDGSEEDDYFGDEDEEEDNELRPGDVVDYADGDYGRSSRKSDSDSSYSKRRRDDDRQAYNDRGAPSRSSSDDLDLDSEGETRYSDRDNSEFGKGKPAGIETRRSSYSASASRARTKGSSPKVAIKAGAGWTAYYPETLSLGMFNYGFEASFFALPWLSIDAGANFWSVSLIEYDDQGNSLRTVRTLPSFIFGATWHGTFHKVVRPYAGIDLGALLYAQAVVQDGDSTQIRPLFAPVVAADIGVDFVIVPNFGVYVGGKFGGSYAARVQETVNSSWDPSTGLAEVWAGALIQF